MSYVCSLLNITKHGVVNENDRWIKIARVILLYTLLGLN